MKQYVLRNLIALDQQLNTLLGGDPDETLSARAWRSKDESAFWSKAYKVIDTGFFWQKQHCRASYLSERRRKHTHYHYH